MGDSDTYYHYLFTPHGQGMGGPRRRTACRREHPSAVFGARTGKHQADEVGQETTGGQKTGAGGHPGLYPRPAPEG